MRQHGYNMQAAQAASGAALQDIEQQQEQLSQQCASLETAHKANGKVVDQIAQIRMAKDKYEAREGFSSLGELHLAQYGDTSALEEQRKETLTVYGTIACYTDPSAFRKYAREELLAQAERVRRQAENPAN